MSEKTCAVVGVGPGNGAAFARRFAEAGHPVALCSRSTEFGAQLGAKLPTPAKAYACDVTDDDAIRSTFAAIPGDLGDVGVLLYNAGSGSFTDPDETSPEQLEQAWRINVRGLFVATQAVLPAMRAAGGGSIVITGATASLRGGVKTTAFAQAKAAQRSLAQSLAKHLGPEKIHVSLLIVDGMVDLPRTRAVMPKAPDDFFLKPADIATTAYALATQASSAWTFEAVVRPFGEKW
ncbi:MAG: SDR family NAD(P)-dependent oxidoreductase [Myxococcota bacterium]